MSQQTSVPVEDEPHHLVVLKNDFVLVMHVTLLPGETTLFHTHSHDRVAIELTDATVTQQKLSETEGAAEHRKPGDVSAATTNAPYTHRVHNLGPAAFEVLDVELLQRPKEPASKAAATIEAENPSARVYKWTLAPGTTSAMHTHDRPYLIISATPLVLKMTDPEGKSFTHEVKAGDIGRCQGDPFADERGNDLGRDCGNRVEVVFKVKTGSSRCLRGRGRPRHTVCYP